MKSIKSTVKSILQGTLVGAGLLVATSVFADEHHGGSGRDQRGHEQQEHRFDRDHGHEGDNDHRDWGRRDWDRRDWSRHDGYHQDFDRGHFGLRVLLPAPRIPFPIFLTPPPVPVFVTDARVINVDPIVTQVPSYRRDGWNGDSYSQRGDYEERVDGYHVTYEFRGRQYNTVMSYDPGDHIRIRVGNGIEVLQ